MRVVNWNFNKLSKELNRAAIRHLRLDEQQQEEPLGGGGGGGGGGCLAL